MVNEVLDAIKKNQEEANAKAAPEKEAPKAEEKTEEGTRHVPGEIPEGYTK